MTQVPASSHGSVFNGGTITTPLEVDQGASAANAEVLIVKDTGGNTVFSVTPDGRVILFSNGTRQEASLILSDNTPGNAGQLAFDTFSGVNLSPEAGSATVLQVGPRVGHTGSALTVAASTGQNTLAVSADNKIGFYDHAVAARPAAIADAVGGVVIDAEARTALNSALAALRTLGLIAT